MIEDSTKFD